jgi:outer membrane biosynthesis protein TonB
LNTLPPIDPRPTERWRLLGLGLLAIVLTVAPAVLAQDGGDAPKAATPTPNDLETLRKLLGVQAPPTRAAEPAPAPEPEPVVAPEPEPEPEPAKPAPGKPSAKKPAPTRSKPKAPPAPKKARPAATTVKTDPAAEPAPVLAEAPAAAFISPDVPPPGTVLDASNLDRWKDFVSPSIAWTVRRGAKLRVVANQPAPMEPARAEATQRYSPQVQLSADKTHLLNYVAGVPFPFVQTDDPDAGIKMISNWDGRIINDDFDIRNFQCLTGAINPDGPMTVERDLITGHFRRLYYLGRQYHDPKPVWPNPENIRYREMLHPILEPFDLKGAGFTYNRFQDPRRQDDSWLYFPQTKRVRRLSTAQRSEGVFGQDIDLDSYGGYSGNPSWTDWRLLGTKTVLATMHGQNYPAKWLPAPNDFLFDDQWEPRDVWVLEGRSRLPGYAFGSRVIYIDRESFFIPYTEIFDLQGRLWKGLVQSWVYKGTIREGSKYKVDYLRTIIAGISLFDMQLNHATRCQFPADGFPEEDGWYMNLGDQEGTTEQAFDVASFIGQGR